jgi:dipeptidyl aminopeptidase/acylaminoacyl peptidase
MQGRRVGVIGAEAVRWSPDNNRIAFTLFDGKEVQLWLSDVPGGGRRQLTHNAADVRDFAWSADGAKVYFTVGEDRAVRKALDEQGRRNGFHLEEFQYFGQMVNGGQPERPLSQETTVWATGADGANERLANDAEQDDYERMRNYAWFRGGAQGVDASKITAALAPPVVAANGRLAWLARDSEAEVGILPLLRLHASPNVDGSQPLRCQHEECTSQMFAKTWWSEDSERVIFWRKTDANLVENEFYEWTPVNGGLKRLYHEDGDEFKECDYFEHRIVCVRQTVTRPDHVISLDTESSEITDLADVNPEFRNIVLGRVERFAWRVPEDTYDAGYPEGLFGFVIYPPDFDSQRKYPVYVAPYGQTGFRRGDVGDEHPLFVYAANGFVVISAQFPMPVRSLRKDAMPDMMSLYDPDKDFPYLTMYMDSTFAALDAIVARGFIDGKRIGIGGLSHGSFVPLFMLQTKDRLSAVSIAGPGWSQYEYYAATRTGRELNPVSTQWPEERAFWSQIDIADHVEKIEAPLLVNYPDSEFFTDWRLPRRMEDAGRVYEAYVFVNENHSKWQPAHRLAIYNRNLDWFRFWLMDREDPSASKEAQYARWRDLRHLQCKNPLSLRDYCNVESVRR